MTHPFRSRWFYRTFRGLGFSFLFAYLLLNGDLRVSLDWALVFPAIALLVSFLLITLLSKKRFPHAYQYTVFPGDPKPTFVPLSEDERTLRKARYLEMLFRNAAILFVPAEDALICVPLLLVGISPASAVVGGFAFGTLHRGGYTYIECAGKTIFYTLAILFVLPHGLLTMSLGHLITDGFGFVLLRFATRQLSKKIESSSPSAANDNGAPRN